MKVKAFIFHKRAEKYGDCQDWFGINSQTNRIAISDGMSQSIFSQWWAQLLVEEYLETGYFPEKSLTCLQKKWQQKLSDEINHREKEAVTNPKRDPWRLKNLWAEKSGAGATLCGVTLGENEWICECLGDSCVITIDSDYGLSIYSSQVGQFSNNPDYFDSFGKGRGTPIKVSINKKVEALLIVTDPFAELFQLHQNDPEFIKKRFKEIINLNTHESFIELVESWRDELGMHNDDSTLIIITDLTNNKFQIEYQDNLKEFIENEKNLENAPITSPTTAESIVDVEKSNFPSLEVCTPNQLIDRLKCDMSHYLHNIYKGKKSKKTIKEVILKIFKPVIHDYVKQ